MKHDLKLHRHLSSFKPHKFVIFQRLYTGLCQKFPRVIFGQDGTFWRLQVSSLVYHWNLSIFGVKASGLLNADEKSIHAEDTVNTEYLQAVGILGTRVKPIWI